MEIGAILFLLSMLLLVGMAVGKPFFDQESQPEKPPTDLKSFVNSQAALPVLLNQQESVFEQLSELEIEAQQGKISTDG